MQEIMAPQDAAFLLSETPEAPMHVGGVQILRRPPGAPDDYVRQVAEEMRGYQPNRRPFDIVPRLGTRSLLRPYAKPSRTWERCRTVDMDDHVRLWALARPGTERELLEMVSLLHAQPLDRSRPLWEFHLIDGLEGDRFAIYTKTHHALMDGMGARGLFEFSESPDERGRPPVWHLTGGGKPEKQERDGSAIDWILGRYNTYSTNARATPEVISLIRSFVANARSKERDNPVYGPFMAPRAITNGELTPRRSFAMASLPLARCKAIAKASGTTLNDVFLSLCGGALRQHLLALNELPDEPLVAIVPVALEKAAGAGNAVLTMFAPMGTDEKDPLARLRSIASSTAAGKKQLGDLTPQARQLYAMMLVHAGTAASIKLPIKLPEGKRAISNAVVSNVPGPRQRFYVNGAELLHMYPASVLAGGCGLNMTILTYADSVDIGILTCPDLIPGANDIAGYFPGALEELEEAVRANAFGEAGGALPPLPASHQPVAENSAELARPRRAEPAVEVASSEPRAGAAPRRARSPAADESAPPSPQIAASVGSAASLKRKQQDAPAPAASAGERMTRSARAKRAAVPPPAGTAGRPKRGRPPKAKVAGEANLREAVANGVGSLAAAIPAESAVSGEARTGVGGRPVKRARPSGGVLSIVPDPAGWPEASQPEPAAEPDVPPTPFDVDQPATPDASASAKGDKPGKSPDVEGGLAA